MICRCCNESYGAAYCPGDPEYDPFAGRCHPCYLGYLYSIFGGWMEPVIELNGVAYAAGWEEP